MEDMRVEDKIIQIVVDEGLSCIEALYAIKKAYYKVFNKSNDLLSTVSTKQVIESKRDADVRMYGVNHRL